MRILPKFMIRLTKMPTNWSMFMKFRQNPIFSFSICSFCSWTPSWSLSFSVKLATFCSFSCSLFFKVDICRDCFIEICLSFHLCWKVQVYYKGMELWRLCVLITFLYSYFWKLKNAPWVAMFWSRTCHPKNLVFRKVQDLEFTSTTASNDIVKVIF